jgi:hemolysin type calcium-binding protein
MKAEAATGRRRCGRSWFALALGVLALGFPAEAAAAPGDILVADYNAFGGTGGVIRVNPATGARTTVSENTMPAGGPSFVEPVGVALEANGDILVADIHAFGGTGGVIRVNPATGARTTVSSNTMPGGAPLFADPLGIALEANGDILVADVGAFGGTGGVIRVNPATGARTTVSSNTMPAGGPSFLDPAGIALAANGDILVADANAFAGFPGGVIRVNPATGARTTVSENTMPAGGPSFVEPFGIALAANGDILVADANAFGGTGGVIRVNPATGARATVSSNTMPAGGPSFNNPTGIALAANGGILVVDAGAFGGTGGVIRVNPATGARTTVSENTMPAGAPSFSGPFGIAVVPGATPTIASTAVPSTAAIGQNVHDTVHVGGGSNPTGDVTFVLYPNPSCTPGTAVFSSGPHVLNGSGDATSNNYDWTTGSPPGPGTYFWAVYYSGDANNFAVATGCNDPSEQLTVTRASPAVTTNASPDISLGGSVSDTAHVAGGFNPSGTVRFRLFSDAGCTNQVFDSGPQPLSGSGNASSGGFTPTARGTYFWRAHYSGDPNNDPVTTACGAPNESVFVGGPPCDGRPSTITGALSGTQTINGTPGPDVIVGGSGIDTINGLGGEDRICGRAGNDILNGDGDDDRIFGESGNDKMDGGAGANNFCNGGSGTDTATNCQTTVSVP